jgi:type I site-specific restriction endonuclease
MKGRGTRTIDPDALASVTPDAGGKTRFVLVDAVGVTESDKTDSRPMESKPSVAFDKLLLGIAMGARDEALDSRESSDSDDGFPLAVADRVFGKDTPKPIIEKLNEMLVA